MGKLFGNGRRGLSQDSKAKKGNSSAPVSFKTFPKILLAGSMGFETVSKAYFPKTLVLVHPTSGDQTNPRHQECTLRIYLRANPWRAPIVVERTYALGETAVSIANQFLREPAATAKELNLFEPNNEFLHYNSWRSVEDKSHEIVTEIENSVLDINEDSVFSIGSHFSLLLSSGKNPSTVNGWKNLTNYLQVVPLRIGYFGDFKRIIKSLEGLYTSATDIQIKKYYAGLLGIAFGRVESIMISKSYKVRATIDSNRGWHLDYLRYFAEDINISITPKFATCRYLMNRGLKFMRRIEVENVDHAYLFKINLLQVVDRSYLHINDKDSLPNQWITSEILYGRRHHYSDSTPLNPPAIRHNSDVKLPVFPGNALPNEEFFSSFAGRHPDIFLAWLHTNEALNLSIEWNLDRVSTAFLSRSTDAQNKAWKSIFVNSDLILGLNTDFLYSILVKGDIEQVRVFLDVIQRRADDPAATKLRAALSRWLDGPESAELNTVGIEIMLAALQHYKRPSEDSYLERLNKADSYLERVKNLALLTRFQPVLQWNSILDNVDWNFGFSIMRLIFNLPSTWWNFDPSAPREDPILSSLREIPLPLEIQEKIVEKVSRLGYYERHGLQAILQDCFIHSPEWGSLGFKIINRLVEKDQHGEVFRQLLADFFKDGLSSSEFILSYTQNAFALGDVPQIRVISDYLDDSDSDSLWRNSESELVRIFMDPAGVSGIWSSLSHMGPRLLSRLSNLGGVSRAVGQYLSRSHVISMNQTQADFLSAIIEADSSALLRSELVDALLVTPYANIQRFVVKGLELKNDMRRHWLVAIESGLPIPMAAAKRYLLSQSSTPSFNDLLLMALDSNVASARAAALQVLADPQVRVRVEDLLLFLSEHTSRDIVEIVAKNLSSVHDPEVQQRFTQDLFAARRKNRRAKEEIKRASQVAHDQLSEAISLETLVRLSLGSNLRDREFALIKLAQMSVETESVSVRETWGVDDV